MKLEVRYKLDAQRVRVMRGIVCISENEPESKMLDELFGSKVGPDGLIGRRIVECRLADGFREHYILIHDEAPMLDKYEVQALIDYHENQESSADSMDVLGSAEHHRKRREHYAALLQKL